jgi:hypothetical protein
MGRSAFDGKRGDGSRASGRGHHAGIRDHARVATPGSKRDDDWCQHAPNRHSANDGTFFGNGSISNEKNEGAAGS